MAPEAPSPPARPAAPTPFRILREDWRGVARIVWKEIDEDNLTLVLAGVSFYALLAIFPAVAAIVAMYGLAAAPETIREHLGFVRSVLPREAYQLIANQVLELTSGEGVKLGVGFVFGLALSMWSASRGVRALMTAMNIAYEKVETRGFVHTNLIALAFTLAAVFVMLGAMAVLGGLPKVVEELALPAWLGWLILILRWPPLAILVLIGLALLYRFGPSRPLAQTQWLSPGAVLAMLLWLTASGALSVYVSNFGKYNETFGSLAAGIVLLLWFYVCTFAVCIGAEVNAEIDYRRSKAADVPGS